MAMPAEIAFVERATGLHLPSLKELSEIESSSRLRAVNDALYLSTPMVLRGELGEPVTTAVGFVLRHDLLITIRFADLEIFDRFAATTAKSGTVHASAGGAFTGLLEAIVDRLADGLEGIGVGPRRGVGAHLSHRRRGGDDAEEARARECRSARHPAQDRPRRRSHVAAAQQPPGLRAHGPLCRDAGREMAAARGQAASRDRANDIISLNDYDAHLANNVQLLLDATLGLINTEQNNIIKVLTIVSVVGVPPTLVASMYGMNFRHMPELDWAWGYPYGLSLIAVSAILPLLWFKLRGWL